MNDLALGFFRDFKGADTVLLVCSKSGGANLRELLASPPDAPIAIHSVAEVAPNHRAALFVAADVTDRAGFTWLAGPDTLPSVHASLDSLALASNGHRYFDLAGVDAQLLVSLNEYDSWWWSTNA
jgi:hypothetical protein